MFFRSWESIGRIILLAILVYIALLAALRVVGKRALAKMSAYDLVVTIALGSLIATIPLQQQITLADGLAAICAYLGLQYALSWLMQRWRGVRRVVKAQPTLVVFEGRMLHDRMRRVRVTDAEVRAAIRSSGRASVAEALAVVLENDGNWSVIGYSDAPDHSALFGLDVPTPVSAQ